MERAGPHQNYKHISSDVVRRLQTTKKQKELYMQNKKAKEYQQSPDEIKKRWKAEQVKGEGGHLCKQVRELI